MLSTCVNCVCVCACVCGHDIFNVQVSNDPYADQLEMQKQHPAWCRPNKWPSPELKTLDGFQTAFMELTRAVVDCGKQLAVHVDKYVQASGTEETKKTHGLVRDITEGRVHKARLLHYFAPNNAAVAHLPALKKDDGDSASWCGWHTDHGSLTGLCSAMYMTDNFDTVVNTDPDAGLYIRNRHGAQVRVKLPANCLAFQIGESEQIRSGGLLMATPHCVRASRTMPANVSRNTLAVFMQPNLGTNMDVPSDVDASKVGVKQHAPGMDFLSFTDATIAMYYGGGGGM